MKLHQLALANSIAVASVLFYLVFYVLSLVAPPVFRLVFNSQFLGADVASLYPSTPNPGTMVGSLVAIAVVGWVFGYVWAWLYNAWAK